MATCLCMFIGQIKEVSDIDCFCQVMFINDKAYIMRNVRYCTCTYLPMYLPSCFPLLLCTVTAVINFRHSLAERFTEILNQKSGLSL